MLTYENAESCETWLVEQLGFDPGDLETFLEISKAEQPKKTYRPYFVGALALASRLSEEVLLEGQRGVTFGDPLETIKGWLAKQRTADRLLQLVIPLGAEPTLENVLEAAGVPSAGGIPGPAFASWG